MRISKSMIKSGLAAFVLLLSVMPEAGARTCFLPDSENCGQGDANVSDISDVGSCRYYNCKDAGYKNDNPYQECYVENTVNIKNNKVSCYAVRCKMSQTACEEKAAGTNKCCNRDVASGCYYVGTCPKDCDRSIYSYDSEQTGDGWTCISCHDGKGTFYKCNYDKTCEEQGYATSCSDEQIAEEVTGAKGQNGEKCYTCKGKPLSCPDGYSTTVKTCATGYKLETNGAIEGAACGKCVEDNVKPRTCADYAEAAGKTYITESDEVICEKVTGHNADLFNIIPREVAADGQCYSCQKARTCRDYNSRYDTIDNIKCSSGYYAAKVGVIGSDGQCYTCEKQKTYIVFDIELERAETPGDYRTSSWDGRGSSSLACDYRVPNACQTGTTHPDDCLDDHKAYFYSSLDWDTSAGNNFKNGNWVLPFDLEIVVTYRVPAYLCNRVEPNWNIKGDNMGVFLDRTERIFFEKGRKVESPVKRNRLTAIDFDDVVWYQNGLLNIEYKIDGKTVAKATSNNGHLDTTYCDDSGCNGPKEINYFSKEIDDVVYKVDISS